MGSKVVVNSGPGFSFALETHLDKVFVHCDVTDNKPSVLKEMLRRWKGFRESIIVDLYALHNDAKNTSAHKHFLKMFNFEYKETLTNQKTGELVELWISKGKEND